MMGVFDSIELQMLRRADYVPTLFPTQVYVYTDCFVAVNMWVSHSLLSIAFATWWNQKHVCIHQKGQRIPKSLNNKTYLINICPTIKHKYDVSLPLQLIHVCALKTTEMIYHFFIISIVFKTHTWISCSDNETLYLCFIVKHLLNMFYRWKILVFFALSYRYIYFCFNTYFCGFISIVVPQWPLT